MLKNIFVVAMLVNFLYASDMAPTVHHIRSYPLNVNNLHIKTNFHLVNKDLDIFGIRDKSNGTASSHGSIGDLNSLNFSFGYGLKEHISLFYKLQFLDLDYAGENLQNTTQDMYVKLNLYNNPSAVLETFSTDIGIVRNSADNISITGSNLGIKKMTNLSDNSFYVRAIAGTKIRSSILDFYLGLKYSKINTKLDSTSYDRSEFALNSGFQYTLELGRYIIETGYQYTRLFNRKIDVDSDINHIMNLSISYAINNQLLISIGSTLLNHQFNGLIPYLHNEKTTNNFDQRYGYGTIGFIYNFNI